MASVTQRIKEIKQQGRFLSPSQLKKTMLNDGKTLSVNENISPSTVGTAVDYLTRYMMTGDDLKAFEISIQGAGNKSAFEKNDKALQDLTVDLVQIKGLDDNSIIHACKAVRYDVWLRNLMYAITTRDKQHEDPDKETIENIRIMVNRSLLFFKQYGPIISDGFTFQPPGKKEKVFNSDGEWGGYTEIVDSGDGDFLTENTLWDFKVKKNGPTSADCLQLLMYYLMGKRSGQKIFKNIDSIGFFNPRLNIVYTYNIKDIPIEKMNEISRDIIGYKK